MECKKYILCEVNLTAGSDFDGYTISYVFCKQIDILNICFCKIAS